MNHDQIGDIILLITVCGTGGKCTIDSMDCTITRLDNHPIQSSYLNQHLSWLSRTINSTLHSTALNKYSFFPCLISAEFPHLIIFCL